MRDCSEVWETGSLRTKKLSDRLPPQRRGEAIWFSSPGRAEIVGNHTDHNGGRVLVSAISCDILAAVLPREGIAEVVSDGYRPIRIPLGDLAAREEEQGRSSALVRGVLACLGKKGPLRGFTAYTASNIFRGAGVSSSAAFSVLIAEIENVLAFGGKLTPLEKAQAGQYAENSYFGKPCGLLDQCGVAYGGFNKIDFASDVPTVTPLPALSGYSVILTNTGGSHASLTPHYASIRREMGDVAAFFGKQTLREVDPRELYDRLPALKKRVSERAVLRSIHFFEENERVERAAEALKTSNKSQFLEQVRLSGESSWKLLQNCFVPGSVTQPLALALKLSEGLMKDRGAFRMMGGGFTGAVLAFVEEGREREYTEGMARVFGADSVYRTSFREAGAERIPTGR